MSRGNLELVTALLDRGADIHRTLPTGRTVLHLAALYDRVEVARLLIARGANVNLRDRQGVAPLNEAALRGFARSRRYCLRLARIPTTRA